MKRLTRCTLVALVALAIFAPQSHAQSGQVLKTVLVGFHTTLDPSTFGSAAIAYAAGDSFSVYRGTGLRNSAQQVDTTVALNVRQFVMPGPYVTAAVSDTTAWLRFAIYPVGTAPAVTADSITVAVQVSDDRVNWTATTYSGPLASVGTTPSSSISLELGSSNSFFYVLRQQLGALGIFNPSTTATAVSVKWCYGFKWIRLLVTGDHTGQYVAEAMGFIPNAGPTYSP